MDKQKIAIIGGGIAGLTFAWQAIKTGAEVVLFNQDRPETPSKVAAGIINPLSVSRKKPIWNAQEFLTEAWNLYDVAVPETVHHTPIIMKMSSTKMLNDWCTSEAAENGWVSFNDLEMEVKNSGWIDTELFLSSYPKNNFTLVNEEIKDVGHISSSFDTLVLATGILPKQYLPRYREKLFAPVLGDVLEVELEQCFPMCHFEGLFVIQLAGDKHLIGSTYVNFFDEVFPDPNRAELLLNRAKAHGIVVTKLLKHRVAVRPAVYSRMPLVGNIENNVYSFCGMGSRALFHAPLAANWLLQNMFAGIPVPKEMEISRALK